VAVVDHLGVLLVLEEGVGVGRRGELDDDRPVAVPLAFEDLCVVGADEDLPTVGLDTLDRLREILFVVLVPVLDLIRAST
jgi:hypothetical protein